VKLLGGFFFVLGILVGFLGYGARNVASPGPFLLAALIFIVLGMVLAAAGGARDKDKRGRHPCPHCREMIKEDATKCPFCRSEFQPVSSVPPQSGSSKPSVSTTEPPSSAAKPGTLSSNERERLKETLDKFRERQAPRPPGAA
jgi:hypothetical protein